MRLQAGNPVAHLLRTSLLVIPLCFVLLGPGNSVRTYDPPTTAEDLFKSDDVFDQIAGEVTLRGLAQHQAATGDFEQWGVDVCLHPDTKPEDAERILRELPTYIPEIEGGLLGYSIQNRWTTTATDGGTGVAGDPITITWGIVPDGTYADGGPSNLVAVFTAAWGGTSWLDKIRNAFQRWQDAIGITYVEVSDDGASMPGNAGVLGVRGDVRIGGRSIDGAGNVLGYDYYPNVGDMVLDTDDVSFYHSPVNNYANLKNVVAHEHGHGMGLRHVIPSDHTKLMEPYISPPGSYVGPQDDDIRGGMRNYGDPYENNDSAAQPSNLGTISDSLIVQPLSIDNGNTDTDWFLVTLNNTNISVQADPIGSSYEVGPDGGSTVWVATDSISDLDIDLYDVTGTTLLATATSGGLGETEVLTTSVPSAGSYQIKVYRKAGTGNAPQRYTMTVYSDPSAGVLAQADLSFSVYPNPFSGRTTTRFLAPSAGTYRLDVYDVTGRQCRSIEGTALTAGWVETVWDGRNDRGVEVPAGVYFIRAGKAGQAETARVLVIR
jgi:hypothetical protein